MKSKSLKKLTGFVMVFAFVFSVVPTVNLMAITSEEVEISSTNQTLHFVMDVRWGNVIDDPTNSDEANFDGSVSVTNAARVSLQRTVLFERHNETVRNVVPKDQLLGYDIRQGQEPLCKFQM